jgi:gamma-glutamylcyclotransferase (GGCT)/AIG2-like uncharacterized protein YtfP
VPHLFVYGTLQHADVMEAVTGLRPGSRRAVADGLQRFAVRGENYPGAVEAPGESLKGRLYLDLDESLFETLDRFEGEQYQRRVVRVTAADVGSTEAFGYVVATESRGMLSGDPWDFDAFTEHHLAAFLADYDGFGRVQP